MSQPRHAVPSPDPTVVAVEGLCFAGKTTLARALAARLAESPFPSTPTLAPLPPFPPRTTDDAAAALDHFLGLERDRARAARAARTGRVLDRSPLTIISYEYGMTSSASRRTGPGRRTCSATPPNPGTSSPQTCTCSSPFPPVAAARQRRRGPSQHT